MDEKEKDEPTEGTLEERPGPPAGDQTADTLDGDSSDPESDEGSQGDERGGILGPPK